MQKFRNTITINRRADEVFAFLADLTNIPKWNYAITSTVQASPGPAGVGTVFRQTRSIPRPGEEIIEITVLEPPERLEVRGQLGPFQATLRYLLTGSGTATQLRNEVELEPRSKLLVPLTPLAVPRVKEAVGQNLGVLKGLLEG